LCATNGLNGCPYQWSLEEAQIVFSCGGGTVAADLCVLGSVSECEGTFLWAWANAAIPPLARRGLDEVRAFGEANALELLSKPEWPGTRAQGLEMAAVAARLLDAAGVWAESAADVTLFFALFHFRRMG
jgi:hypothetical protein